MRPATAASDGSRSRRRLILALTLVSPLPLLVLLGWLSGWAQAPPASPSYPTWLLALLAVAALAAAAGALVLGSAVRSMTGGAGITAAPAPELDAQGGAGPAAAGPEAARRRA